MIEPGRLIELMKIELECVRQNCPNRDCYYTTCDLGQSRDELIQAYTEVIGILYDTIGPIPPNV